MLYVTSSRTASPEKIILARESGRNLHGKKDAYEHASEDLAFVDAARRLSEGGSVLYAVRLADGLIKIGWTSNLLSRWRWLKCRAAAVEFLGFTFGSRQDEAELHRSLAGHAEHGREYYRPDPEVLAVVNGWRSQLGRDPLAA